MRTRFKAEQRPEFSQVSLVPFRAAEVEELLRSSLDWRASPGPVKAESWTGPRTVLEGEFLPLPGQCVAIPLHLTERNLT